MPFTLDDEQRRKAAQRLGGSFGDQSPAPADSKPRFDAIRSFLSGKKPTAEAPAAEPTPAITVPADMSAEQLKAFDREAAKRAKLSK